MITRKFKIDVNNNTASTSKIILYKGDLNLLFNIELNKFKFSFSNIEKIDASIENKEETFSMIINDLKFNDQHIILLVNNAESFILEDVGVYNIQLHLYDENGNRISVPPFNIEVRDTIY